MRNESWSATDADRAVQDGRERGRDGYLRKKVCTLTGIAFGQGTWAGHLEAGGAVDIIASLEINEFRGQRNLQLMVEDIRSAQGKS